MQSLCTQIATLNHRRYTFALSSLFAVTQQFACIKNDSQPTKKISKRKIYKSHNTVFASIVNTKYKVVYTSSDLVSLDTSTFSNYITASHGSLLLKASLLLLAAIYSLSYMIAVPKKRRKKKTEKKRKNNTKTFTKSCL